jgi:hypothetical protein
MKTRKTDRKPPQHFSEEFKRKVIDEHLRTGIPKVHLQDSYGIGFKSAIITWMKQLGYMPKGKVAKFALTNPDVLARPTKKHPEPGTAEAEIARLKRELEDERLRSQMYLRMIDIAETEYHIPIRKKPGTK